LALLISTGCAVQPVALTVTPLENPTGNDGLQPNWSVVPGGAILSWTEPSEGGQYDLRYTLRRDAGWSEVRTIAKNRKFFRHPAELPEVMQLSDNFWLAHWVEMPMETSEAEYIYISSSTDGVKWTAPVVAHEDRSEVEHGLVSMIATGPQEASMFWLFTPEGEDGPGHLMRTVIAAGKVAKEERIDADVCQCCSTAVANTSKGLAVAYRDHTQADVRDISVTRLENGSWTPGKNVRADQWTINACPVNGPAIAAKGDHVAVAWHTAAQDQPRTQFSFSNDSGSTFGNEVVVSTGRSQGFTTVILEEGGGALVSWIEQDGNGSSRLLVRTVDTAGKLGPVQQVATGTRTALGYPRLVQAGKDTLIAWGNANSKIGTATLRR
jgi:hypothetical protein